MSTHTDEEDSKLALVSSNNSSNPPSRRQPTFPQKLRAAIHDDSNILEWSANGLVFCVHSPTQLEKVLLPRHFPSTRKYSSFTRKLNRWGFRRARPTMPPLDNDELILFVHPYFQRDAPELEIQMAGSQEKRDRKASPVPALGNLRDSQAILQQRLLRGMDDLQSNDMQSGVFRNPGLDRLTRSLNVLRSQNVERTIVQQTGLDALRAGNRFEAFRSPQGLHTTSPLEALHRSSDLVSLSSSRVGLDAAAAAALRGDADLGALRANNEVAALNPSNLDSLRSISELELLRNQADLASLLRRLRSSADSSLLGSLGLSAGLGTSLVGSIQPVGGNLNAATALALHQRRQVMVRLQLEELQRMQNNERRR